jgi:hypothetical protein
MPERKDGGGRLSEGAPLRKGGVNPHYTIPERPPPPAPMRPPPPSPTPAVPGTQDPARR